MEKRPGFHFFISVFNVGAAPRGRPQDGQPQRVAPTIQKHHYEELLCIGYGFAALGSVCNHFHFFS